MKMEMYVCDLCDEHYDEEEKIDGVTMSSHDRLCVMPPSHASKHVCFKCLNDLVNQHTTDGKPDARRGEIVIYDRRIVYSTTDGKQTGEIHAPRDKSESQPDPFSVLGSKIDDMITIGIPEITIVNRTGSED